MSQREQPTLDPPTLRALLRQGDPAAELPAAESDRVRRRIVAAASRGAAPAAGRRWDQSWKVLAATACALALTIGLGRQVARPRRPPGPPGPPVPRYQIDFRTPGGTRIVWTVIPDRPGVRAERRRAR